MSDELGSAVAPPVRVLRRAPCATTRSRLGAATGNSNQADQARTQQPHRSG